jgi:hypothetical protein
MVGPGECAVSQDQRPSRAELESELVLYSQHDGRLEESDIISPTFCFLNAL